MSSPIKHCWSSMMHNPEWGKMRGRSGSGTGNDAAFKAAKEKITSPLKMGFKMKGSPYNEESGNTPILHVDMDEGTLGMATNNGSILVNKDIKDPKQQQEVVDHEMVHIKQIKDGRLSYDEDNVYWEGKKFSRDDMNEGAKNLPWEKEAYSQTKDA